jgi:hypothetical protein
VILKAINHPFLSKKAHISVKPDNAQMITGVFYLPTASIRDKWLQEIFEKFRRMRE